MLSNHHQGVLWLGSVAVVSLLLKPTSGLRLGLKVVCKSGEDRGAFGHDGFLLVLFAGPDTGSMMGHLDRGACASSGVRTIDLLGGGVCDSSKRAGEGLSKRQYKLSRFSTPGSWLRPSFRLGSMAQWATATYR